MASRLALAALDLGEEKEIEIDFTKPWDHSDIVFVVQDEKVHANKMILSMASPMMKAMFKAENEKKSDEIPLPGENFDKFVELMKIAHPPHKELDGSNVYDLIPLAQKYEMGHLTRCCENFLLTLPPSVKNLRFASTSDMPRLQSVCLEYAKSVPLGTLEGNEDYDKVKPEVLVQLLTLKLKACLACAKTIQGHSTYRQIGTGWCSSGNSHAAGLGSACIECSKLQLSEIKNLVSKDIDCA